MSAPEYGWDDEHVRRYRDRVFAERARLRAAMRDPAARQRDVLADLLSFNGDTDYGRAHSFGRVSTVDDFRKAVPINDYSSLEPWIERMAAGEHGVLTADDPVVYFTSSGSTGDHKKVPVTARFMHTTFFPFFYAAWAPLAEHFPATISRPNAVLNLKHDPLPLPRTTASGRPHLGASQVDFGVKFGEPLSAEPGTVARWATLPVEVAADDHLEKSYVRLRLAVEHDLRLVIGINPAMVAAVPYQLDQWWSRIIREVRDGTVRGVRHGSPNPERARELEQLTNRFGRVRPAHVWPRMEAIFCWTGGLASLYLPRLREEFGIGVSVLPAPVAASEGPVGVTLDRHPRAGSLVVTASVHEFVPADEDVTQDSATLLPDELTVGQEYHAIYSHVGGLYRYAGGDVLRVADIEDGVPRLEYAGRALRSDVAGERLRESQVIRALADALAGGGLDVRNVACHARSGARPGYEFALAPRLPWSDDELSRLAHRLDGALSAESPDYRSSRSTGRLAPPTLHRVAEDTFLREWTENVRQGTRPAQVKDRLFRRDAEAWQRLVDTEALGNTGNTEALGVTEALGEKEKDHG